MELRRKKLLVAGAATVLTLLVVVLLIRKKKDQQRPGCKGDSDCPQGQSCQSGKCGQKPPPGPPPGPPPCQKDSDCTAGNVCKSGQCVPRPVPPPPSPPAATCQKDSDCAAGKVCKDGQCAPAPTPPPGPVACNQWRQYKDFSAPPSWAWSPNPNTSGNPWQPGVGDMGGGTPPCLGGIATTGNAAGTLYGSQCSVPDDPYNIPPSDANMFLIERDPACGSWNYTSDPSNAFSYDGVPVCFSQKNSMGWGVLSKYDTQKRTCQRAGGDYDTGDQVLVANDAVPQAALRSRAYHSTGPRF